MNNREFLYDINFEDYHHVHGYKFSPFKIADLLIKLLKQHNISKQYIIFIKQKIHQSLNNIFIPPVDHIYTDNIKSLNSISNKYSIQLLFPLSINNHSVKIGQTILTNDNLYKIIGITSHKQNNTTTFYKTGTIQFPNAPLPFTGLCCNILNLNQTYCYINTKWKLLE